MERDSFYQKVRQLKIVSTKMLEGLYGGNYRSVFKGPGLEFDEVRNYVVIDDARFIDWNVSSRMGEPFTKTFREEREMVLMILVDVSPSLNMGTGYYNKRDIVNILLAHLTMAAVANNDQVGALFFSDRIEAWVPPTKGKKHALRLIQDGLSIVPQGKGSDLGLALRVAHESLKRRGIIMTLSDFRSSPYYREAAVVAKRHDLIAMMINDPLDEHFPPTGLIELEDPESGSVVKAAGWSSRFRKEYHDYWTLHKLTWLRECRRRKVETIEISTMDDPAARLLQFFNRRQKR
jgi:uncharacterized protein (DUF58 family)